MLGNNPETFDRLMLNSSTTVQGESIVKYLKHSHPKPKIRETARNRSPGFVLMTLFSGFVFCRIQLRTLS